MKALFCTISALLIVGLVSCGGGNSTPPPNNNPPPPSGFTAADLSGDYVATFIGTEGTGETYFVLRFTADGKGVIKAGTLDYNREEIFEGMQSTTFTGTYTVASDGRTNLTIQTSSPSLNGSTGPFTFHATLRADGNFEIMPFVSPLRGSGSAWKVHNTAVSVPGSYSFMFTGGALVLGLLDGAGQMTLDSAGNIAGTWDLNLRGGPSPNVSFTGTYTVGADRRGTATLSSTGPTGWYAAPTQLSLQVLSNDKIVFLSQDKGLAVVGTAERQTGAFNAGTFAGAYVLSSSGTAYDPQTTYYLGPTATVGRIVSNGSGALTGGILDQNWSHTMRSDSSVSGSYNVDMTGRGTATLNTSNGVLDLTFYLVSPNRAFFVTMDQWSQAHGALDLQSNVSYSNTTLKGDYAMLVAADYMYDGTCAGGQLIMDGAGGLKGTLDVMTGGTTYPALSLSGTYSVGTDGRATATITNNSNGGVMNVVFYLVSPQEARILGTDGNPLLVGTVKQQ